MSHTSKLIHSVPLAVAAALLSACGGGGDSPASPIVAPQPPTPTPTPAPTPPPSDPILSTTKTMLDGTAVGTDFWRPGPTPTGGQGATIGGIECVANVTYHVHAHLTIINEGRQLAVPGHVGLQGCAYELHTHDTSGIVHVEAASAKKFTLANFFTVWGYTLSDTEVAGISGKPVTAFITDGDRLTRYMGTLGDIELVAHRDVALVIGTIPAQLPAYQWKEGT